MECDGVPVLSHGVVNRGEPPLHAELVLSRDGWEVNGTLWSQHSLRAGTRQAPCIPAE